MMPVFRMLAKMKGLRGTALDIFGYSADRKLERELIASYEKDVATVLGLLSPLTLDTAIEILSLPERIRGYGPVKEKAVQDAKVRYAQLTATSSTRRRRRARSRRNSLSRVPDAVRREVPRRCAGTHKYSKNDETAEFDPARARGDNAVSRCSCAMGSLLDRTQRNRRPPEAGHAHIHS